MPQLRLNTVKQIFLREDKTPLDPTLGLWKSASPPYSFLTPGTGFNPHPHS